MIQKVFSKTKNFQDEIHDDGSTRESRIEKVREKLRKERQALINEDDDEDYDKLIEEQRTAEQIEEKEKLAAEIRQMQKDYKKSMRGPKEPEAVDGEALFFSQFTFVIEEATTSAGVKEYKKLQLKFKSATKGIVKTIDPKREDQVLYLSIARPPKIKFQTIALLERFKTKLDRSTVFT